MNIDLIHKPDFEETRKRWRAFWAGEMIDRPCVCVTSMKDGAEPGPHYSGLHHPDKDPVAHVRAFDKCAESIYFAGDSVPCFNINFGPDAYAAFLGADMEFSFEQNTSWAIPFINDWDADTKGLDEPTGYWWDAILDFTRETSKIADGRFLVGVIDLHSNMDCMAAARGVQNLLFDLMDCPDKVESAHNRVRKTYTPIYNALRRAGMQDKYGCSSWLPFYCEEKFAITECDFICMISPELSRRFVIPALEEEAEFLGHCCFHLDGPDAIVHLDDILP